MTFSVSFLLATGDTTNKIVQNAIQKMFDNVTENMEEIRLCAIPAVEVVTALSVNCF